MANILINNKDTFINPQFVMSIAYNDEEKIYELNMTDYSKFVLESVSYNLLKVKKENPIAPFDMKEYERMGGTKELLKKNKYVQPSIVPGGGLPGKSAYQIWLDNGGDGNETDFLKSLEGATGDSAYQVAVKQGFEGSEDEWLTSLVGPEGPKGETGSGLDIKKVYATVDEMNEGYATDGLPEGSMVIVSTADPSEVDNGKIYLKGPEQYDFLVDIAVVTEAVQGPKGEDGATFTPTVSSEGLISWTNDKGLDNPESVSIIGPQGKIGFNGLPGVNGLSIKLSKSDSHIQATYVGKRILQGNYSPEKISPTMFNSYQFTTLNGFVLENIPEESTKVRVQLITFVGLNDDGEMVGSTNPAYRPGVVSPGASPHLGTLDPSNGTTYPVKSGKCIIDCEVDTKAACAKELEDLNKAIASSGKVGTKIESMIYEFTYLNAEDVEIGKTNIRERFLTDITDVPQNLVALEDLKGQDGAQGATGATGEPGPAGAPGKDAKSLLELFRENGYSGDDEPTLVKALVALIQPS